MSVDTAHLNALWDAGEATRNKQAEDRRKPATCRLYDGNWVLAHKVNDYQALNAQWKDNDTGAAYVHVRTDHPAARWALDIWGRPTKNIHVIIEKDGARWGGRLKDGELITNADGTRVLQLNFLHDYEELKHVYLWPSPLSPAAVQFPRAFTLLAPSKWGLMSSLYLNVYRLEGSLWALPNDPLDLASWSDTFDHSRWSMRVMPHRIIGDPSPITIVNSRMKTWHDVAAPILEQAHLSVVCRRWLEGDPLPWAGAKVRNGTLLIDIEDKSGWWNPDGTATHGNLLTGFIRTIQNITGTDVDVTQTVVPAPGTDPDEYRNKRGWLGTVPGRPYVVYRDDGLTGIETSSFKWEPATSVQMIAGGKSAYGVNETITATIQLVGNYLGMLFTLPTLGSIASTFITPLIEDTILAWHVVKSSLRDSEQRNPAVFNNQALGWSKYWEHLCEGADRGYTISAWFALRKGYWDTREKISHQIQIRDGAPWYIGDQGQGHFWLGDIIGATVRDLPGNVMVTERVTELTYNSTREERGWSITLGDKTVQQSPLETILSKTKDALTAVRDIGLI